MEVAQSVRIARLAQGGWAATPVRSGLRLLLVAFCGFGFDIHAGSSSTAEVEHHSDAVGCSVDSIRLEDQFGQLHVCLFPAAKPIVLLAADKRGNEQLDPWIKSVTEGLGQRVTILGVADVRGVPGLFQGKVSRKFREVQDHPVLMDWKGEILDVLQPKKDLPNIYLLSRTGVVLMHSSGEATDERVHQFLEGAARHLAVAINDEAEKEADPRRAPPGDWAHSAAGKPPK